MMNSNLVGEVEGTKETPLLTSPTSSPPPLSEATKYPPPVAVVGGLGYVGKLLAYQLAARGHPTTIFDLPPRKKVVEGVIPQKSSSKYEEDNVSSEGYQLLLTPSSLCIPVSPQVNSQGVGGVEGGVKNGGGVGGGRVDENVKKGKDSANGQHTEEHIKHHQTSDKTDILPPHDDSNEVASVECAATTARSFPPAEGRRSSAKTAVSFSSSPVYVHFKAMDLAKADVSSLKKSLQGVKRVFHLATADYLSRDMALLYAVNVEGTAKLLSACEAAGVEEFIYCSSASVVFHTHSLEDANEDLPRQSHAGVEPYNATKAQAEKLVLTHSKCKSMKTIAIRPHGIYGHNGFGKLGIVDPMLDAIKAGKSRFFVGDDSPLADFTHVENVTHALMLAGEALAAGGVCVSSTNGSDSDDPVAFKAFNVTDGEHVRFWSFLSNLAGELGYCRPYIRIPYTLMMGVAHFSDFFLGSRATFTTQKVRLLGLSHTFDISRAKAYIGYKPCVTHARGFQHTIKYLMKNDDEVEKKLAQMKKKQTDTSPPTFFQTAAVMHNVGLVYSLGVLTLLGLFLLLAATLYLPGRISSDYLDSLPRTAIGALCVPIFILTLMSYVFAHKGSVLSIHSSIPLLGDFLMMSKGNIELCVREGRACRGAFSLSLFGKRLVYLCGESGLNFFFKASDEECSLREVYSLTEPIFGKGVLYSTDSSRRQQQMHYLAQGLSDRNMMTYVDKFTRECEAYFSSWGDEGVCEDIKHLFSNLITKTSASCLLGDEIRTQAWEDFSRLIHDLDEGLTYLAALAPSFPIEKHRKRDKARKEMAAIFADILAKRRAKASSVDTQTSSQDVQPKATSKYDLLNTLINAEYRDGSPFSDDEICGLMIAITFAGQHTSSVTATWLLINLLCHKETILTRLLKEQINLGKLSFESVSQKTEYLGNCMIESLRLHNPLGNLARYIKTTRRWNGHVFAPGTIICVSTYAAGRDSDIFEDPLEFHPERWETENWEEWRKMYKYVQFGAGRHTCMGRRFALLQVKTIISYILRNFVLTPLSNKPLIDDSGMIVTTASPFSFKYKRVSYDEDQEKWRHSWEVCLGVEL